MLSLYGFSSGAWFAARVGSKGGVRRRGLTFPGLYLCAFYTLTTKKL